MFNHSYRIGHNGMDKLTQSSYINKEFFFEQYMDLLCFGMKPKVNNNLAFWMKQIKELANIRKINHD